MKNISSKCLFVLTLIEIWVLAYFSRDFDCLSNPPWFFFPGVLTVVATALVAVYWLEELSEDNED